jgi:hypothetical protein
MLLYDVIDAFDKAKLKYVIVGGYALALHGIVRATMDIDIVLSLNLKDFEMAESTLEKIGLQSRLPVRAKDVISMRKEYIENRNLIAWSFVDYKNPSRQLDILITNDLKDFSVEKISLAGRKINVVSLNDLLKMKQKAGRPQDLVDVQSIKDKLNEKK